MKNGICITSILILISLVCLLGGCSAGTWSVSGTSNYETFQASVMYAPDPNGGIGLRLMTDSAVPDDTDENVALGPCLEFYLGDVVADLADRVLPGEWVPLQNAPARLYGTIAILWETGDGDRSFVFLPGTELRLFPQSSIHPAIRTEYRTVEGGTGDEGLLTTFGAAWEFK